MCLKVKHATSVQGMLRRLDCVQLQWRFLYGVLCGSALQFSINIVLLCFLLYINAPIIFEPKDLIFLE